MLTMEMVLHKDVDFAPKFGKSLVLLKRWNILNKISKLNFHQIKNNDTPTTLMQAPTTSLNVTF